MQVTGSKILTTSNKFALVPDQYFIADEARAILVETTEVDDALEVSHVQIPYFKAVLVYAHPADQNALPEQYYLLEAAEAISDHNKIIVSYDGAEVNIVVAQDSKMLVCNVYKALDFTTAEYYIFLSLKKFSLNPEISTIYFHSPLADEQRLSLYRYFKDVESI